MLVLGGLVGFGLSQVADFWKPLILARSDIRAYTLIFNVGSPNVKIQLALVNQGNRQGCVTDIAATFPIAQGGYVSQPPDTFEVGGVPIVLNPGDIHIVTITGKVHMDSAYFNGQATVPSDGEQLYKPDHHKIDFALRVQALDFKGLKYRSYWRLVTLFVSKDAIRSWQYGPEFGELRVFNKAAFEDVWFPLEYIGPKSTPMVSPPQ